MGILDYFTGPLTKYIINQNFRNNVNNDVGKVVDTAKNAVNTTKFFVKNAPIPGNKYLKQTIQNIKDNGIEERAQKKADDWIRNIEQDYDTANRLGTSLDEASKINNNFGRNIQSIYENPPEIIQSRTPDTIDNTISAIKSAGGSTEDNSLYTLLSKTPLGYTPQWFGLEAGLELAGSNGLRKTINNLNEGKILEGAGSGAMDALNAAMIKVGGVSKISKLASKPAKFLWNEGKIIQRRMPFNPNNFYRTVGKDAIQDAKNTGIIRTNNPDLHFGPYFGKGEVPFAEKYVIEGKPDATTWINGGKYVDYQYNLRDATPRQMKEMYGEGYNPIQVLDSSAPLGVEAFPYSNGSVNSQPVNSGFKYYKKHPIIGWRPHEFKKGGGIHIKKENRGKFTEYCGGKVTSECISKGKNSPNPAIRKRATFAANARKWKH